MFRLQHQFNNIVETAQLNNDQMPEFHCHCECLKQMKNKLPLSLMAYFAFCLSSYMLKKTSKHKAGLLWYFIATNKKQTTA